MTGILPPGPAAEHSPRFIGLDLAKAETQLALLNAAGQQIHSRRFASTRENFLQLASELGPLDCVALEVTTNSFTIARLLLPSGARITLSDPMRTRIIAESKFKNDKLDARKLAELDRVDYLPKVWLPDPETETLRHLMSQRQSLVDRRTEQKNRVHALLHRYLLHCSVSDLFGVAGRSFLNSLLQNETLALYDAFELHTSLQEIDRLETQLDEFEQLLADFIVARPRWLAQLDQLLSVTGVSLVVGAGLLAAIGEVTRFAKPQRLASYFGLVPSTYQSGDSRAFHGRITKRGRAQARWLVIEAAEHLRKSPGPLRSFYQRLAKKRGHNIAVVAVARKLTELCWHLLTKAEDFIYALPRLTDEKRARVRFLARQWQAKVAGQPVPKAKGGGHAVSPLYATGQQGRAIKTQLVRQAACQAEHQYEKLLAARATAARSGSAATAAAANFNPLRPMLPDWQRVLERVAAQLKPAAAGKVRRAKTTAI
jgi:transposase